MSKIDTEHLSKIASEIASSFPQDETIRIIKNMKSFKNASPEDDDQIMTINPLGTVLQKNLSSPNTLNVDDCIDLTKSISTFQPDVYSFYGYSLPKNTLYLIIILIIVGIMIWYMTSNINKKKEAKIVEDKDDEKPK